MSEATSNRRKKRRRRTVLASMSLLAVFVAGSLVFAFVENVLDAVDRAH